MSVLAIISLIIVSQTVLLIIILLSINSPRVRIANRLLACMLLAFGTSLVMLFWKQTGLVPLPDHYRKPFYSLSLAIGPLLYLYTRALVDAQFRLRRRDGLHFLPMLLFITLSLPAFGIYHPPYIVPVPAPTPEVYQVRVSSLHGLLSSLLGIAYCLAGLGVLKRYQARLLDHFSSIERLSLVWLKRMLTVYMVMSVALMAALIALFVSGQAVNPVAFFILPISVLLIFYIAIAGFRWAQVSYWQAQALPLMVEESGVSKPMQRETGGTTAVEVEACAPAEDLAQAVVEQAADSESRPKYERSGLAEEDLQQRWRELQALMAAEKPHLDDDLHLGALAERAGMSSHELSQVLNRCAGQNFYDYVNTCRVRESQALLADADLARRSLLEIAERAGFRSKSTFNKYFKSVLGVTPSEYRRQQRSAVKPS